MVTIKDIAKITGVSQGTVSNVLNGKGNVSVKKIKLVEDAAEKLGYSINAQAKQLRRYSKLSTFIAIILPNILETRYSLFFSYVKKYLEEQNYTVLLFVTNDSPYTEKSVINTIAAIRAVAVITISCCSDDTDVYKPILNNGGLLLFALRDVPGINDFIGFDFLRAGRDIAEMLLSEKLRNVGLLIGLEFFSNECEFERGFLETFDRLDKHESSVSVVRSTIDTTLRSALTLFAGDNIPDVIVTTSIEFARSIEYAYSVDIINKLPRLVAVAPAELSNHSQNRTEYYFDYCLLGIKAAEYLLKCIKNMSRPGAQKEKGEQLKMILPPKGFVKNVSIIPLSKKTTINVLMIKGPSAKALISMTPSFTKQSNINVNYVVLPPEEIFETSMRIRDNTYYDVLRISVSLLPIFPKETLRVFESHDFERITEGMIPRLVKDLSYVDGMPCAIPFDVGTQMLIYRKDLFNNPTIKRMYYEMYNKNLEIPTNFKDFNTVSWFFNKKLNPNSPIAYGSSGAMGSDSEIFASFSTRYTAFSGYQLFDKNKLSFDIDAAINAIENYKEAIESSLIITSDNWFGAKLKNFIAGNTAMESTAFNYSSNIIDLRESNINSQLGYAPLPGGNSPFGGGSLAIIKSSCKQDAAMKFIEWACGSYNAELFTYLGGTSPHSHVYQNIQLLDLYPWYKLLPSNVENAQCKELWEVFHVYKLERLVGYVIRSVFNNVMTSVQGAALLEKELPDCLL